MLLLVSLVLTSGCSKHLPTPPVGELYLHDEPKQMALCSKLGSKEVCPALPIAQTDKYFLLSPSTLSNVLNYIDELVYEIKKPQSVEMKAEAIQGLEALKLELQEKQIELNGQ